MTITDIIRKKRDGGELTDEEITFFAESAADGSVPDYQLSALLMAIYLRGMNQRETVSLTLAMAKSGDMLDLSQFGSNTADKHSTGGVGDKTSLIVAPVVAAAGCTVAKMSGRGLGHTGGTVDKLESVPGYKTSLSPEEFISVAARCGVALVGQTGCLAPADKKLYALRDVTETVGCMPLIVSSIMSKKLAAGSRNIVLDVKTGSGAFMKTAEEASLLASEMVEIGKKCGRNVSAVITSMAAPLGSNIGNSLEVTEAVAVLRDGLRNDLSEVSLTLASELISQTKNISPGEAREIASEIIDSGKGFEKMKQWISLQGGDTRYLDDLSLFPVSKNCVEVVSPVSGYLCRTDALKLGMLCVELGAGRKKKDDAIDHSAGIVMKAKPGDYVKEGELLALLHTSKSGHCEDFSSAYLDALEFSPEKPVLPPLIYETIR